MPPRVPAGWLLPLLFAAGCVVSTRGGAGAPLETPPRPKVVRDPPEPTDAPATDRDPLQKVRARHILIAYRGALRAAPEIVRTREQARERAEEALRRALAGEAFQELASEYSDDLASAARGGDLGTFSRQDMVAEFSEAAFALEPGEISDVVESPFGFHVINRHDPDATDAEPAPDPP